MRNWHPLLPDTLKTMAQDGVRRAIGFVCAPHRSLFELHAVPAERRRVRGGDCGAGLSDVAVTYVGDWHAHARFIEANARPRACRAGQPSAAARIGARLVFTAHSIPVAMAGAARYRAQLTGIVAVGGRSAGMVDWALVFQSRSGRPEDPWLEPDICDYLRAERARGLAAAVMCPIGFVCDHVEVLYDLDRRGRSRVPRRRLADGACGHGE